MAKKTFKKLDYKAIVGNSLYTAGGGVAASLVDKFVPDTNSDGTASRMQTYVKLIGGIALPALVKSPAVEKIGDAMLAVAAYQLSEEFIIPKMSSITGIGRVRGIGAARPTQSWMQARTVAPKSPVVSGQEQPVVSE